MSLSPFSSVNDSSSACAVVYSFPAVKVVPWKCLLFTDSFCKSDHHPHPTPVSFSSWLEEAGCLWVLRWGAQEQLLPLAPRWIPSIIPSPLPLLSFLRFQSCVSIRLYYINIDMRLCKVQKGNWCELVLYFLLINDEKTFFLFCFFFWKRQKNLFSSRFIFLFLCLHCLFSLRHWSSL